MNFAALVVGYLSGVAIGALYLLALWWTVRRATRSGNANLLLVSFVARAALVLLAFYGLRGLGAGGLVLALLGFLSARWLLTRLLGPRREGHDEPVA